MLAARPGSTRDQPGFGYRVTLSGSELHREGDACEGRGRGGTDCAGNLHTPDCEARGGGGPHARTGTRACGGDGKIYHTPQSLSRGRRGGATARSALGWYRTSVGVPGTLAAVQP